MRGLEDEMIDLRKSVQSASSVCLKTALDNITLVPNPTTGELRITSYELSACHSYPELRSPLANLHGVITCLTPSAILLPPVFSILKQIAPEKKI